MSKHLRYGLMATSVLFSIFTASAYAQDTQTDKEQAKKKDDGIPVIIVTADKFAKSVQKTPMAVSVVSGQEITQEGRTKMDEVLENQPATVVQGAAKGFTVSIRGLGLSLPPQLGQGAVSVNYDGAYSMRAENASAGFYDLERVEVLRGPQGTLYGRSAIGGVVNVISKDPSLKSVSGYITGEVGSYSLGHVEGAINLPLSDQFALRLSGDDISRKGYISNGHDDNVAQAGRAKLLYQPNADTKLVFGAETTHVGGKGPGGVYLVGTEQEPTSRYTNDVSYGSQDVNYGKLWATLTTNVGPGVLFVEPSYQQTKGVAVGSFGGNFADAEDPQLNIQKALEVRYSSAAGATTEWNVGYYHFDSHNQQKTLAGACEDAAGTWVLEPGYAYNAPPGVQAAGGCVFPSASWVATTYLTDYRNTYTDGVFGQVTRPLSQSLRLIVGVRASSEKVTGRDNNNVAFTLPTGKDNHVDYRIGFEDDIRPGSMLYGTIATGYRQSGYNFDSTLYAPEKMTSYEMGIKNRLDEGRLQLNVDAFYYDYSSFQLVLANFSVNPPQINVKTMPAREYGVEFEGMAKLGDNGQLSGSLVLLDSRLNGRDGLFVGAPFPNSPKSSLKLTYTHNIELGNGATLIPRFDFRAVGSQYVYPDEKTPATIADVQKAYTTGDVSMLYRAMGSAWSVNVYCKNVNNALIKQSYYFGYAQLAAPRTYGVVLSRNF